jgi:ribosome-binding protein aMBF1 (putative translation factor)
MTSDAMEIIGHELVGGDPEMKALVREAFENAVIGQIIYDARTSAKLTQKQLADLVGTDQAVISRLEDADYRGHSMAMLGRIAAALGKRVDIRLVDAA